MKWLKIFLRQSIFLICAGLLVWDPETSVSAVRSGLETCSRTILPTLFPFLVLTRCWTALDLHRSLQRLAGPCLSKLFHRRGMETPFILGAIAGYPVGAQSIAQLYQNREISRAEAIDALRFCCNAGPAFLIGIVGIGLFQHPVTALALELIHLGSAVLIGVCFRPGEAITENHVVQPRNPALFPTLTDSIAEAGETALQICVYVLLFSVFGSHLSGFLPDNAFSGILLSTLELAGGIKTLRSLSMNTSTLFILCSALLGWGGLCVHGQTASILAKTKLPFAPYLIGKLLHALFSGIAAALVYPFLPLNQSCMTGSSSIWTPYWPVLPVLFLLAKSFSGKKPHNPV